MAIDFWLLLPPAAKYKYRGPMKELIIETPDCDYILIHITRVAFSVRLFLSV